MKRLFIGVPVTSENAVKIVSDWQTNGSLNVNRLAWTKPSNWHITLVFLGLCPEGAVNTLGLLMDEAFNESYAYTSLLTGVGVFPGHRKPNVLWLGLQNILPLQPSCQLLIDLLLKNDFLFDSKPLKPHLTVARVKSLANHASFDAFINDYSHFNFGKVIIDRVILYESLSTPNGVVYHPLYIKMLKDKE